MDHPTLLETQGTMQKSNRFLQLAGVLIVLLIFAAAGTYLWVTVYNSCQAEAVKEASALLINYRDLYDATYQVATGAPPNSIVRPVTALQEVFIDTQEIIVPACMRTAKNELIEYMGTVIRAFQAYGAGEANATFRGLIDQSNAHYENFTRELDEVNKCAPFCFP